MLGVMLRAWRGALADDVLYGLDTGRILANGSDVSFVPGALVCSVGIRSAVAAMNAVVLGSAVSRASNVAAWTMRDQRIRHATLSTWWR